MLRPLLHLLPCLLLLSSPPDISCPQTGHWTGYDQTATQVTVLRHFESKLDQSILQLFLDMWMYCPGHAGVKESDRAEQTGGKSNHHQWLAPQKIWNAEELAGTKPRTSHHWSPGGNRRWKRKPSMIFLVSMREGHCQSNKPSNYLKSTLKEAWEMGWSTYGFFPNICDCALLMQVQLPGVARDFAPRVNFQCTLTAFMQPACATARSKTCRHLKNPSHTIVWTHENKAQTMSILEDGLWLPKWQGNWNSSWRHSACWKRVYYLPKGRNAEEEDQSISCCANFFMSYPCTHMLCSTSVKKKWKKEKENI